MSENEKLEIQAWECFLAEDYKSAINLFDNLHEVDPVNVASYQGRIACNRKLLDFLKAGKILEEALLRFPSEPGILSEKAWFYLEQNEFEKAIIAFEDVLQIKRDDIGLYLWYLFLLRRQKYFSKTNSVINEIKKIFPDNINLIIEEGWMFFYISKFKESLGIFKSILDIDPLNEIAYQGIIACLRKQGKLDEALRQTIEAEKSLKPSPGILSEKGWIYLEIGKCDEAELSFIGALHLVKNDPYAHINLAWALTKQNSPKALDEAYFHCQQALDIDSDLPEIWGCLGNIEYKKGNIREAENCFLQSIQKDQIRGCYCDLGALYIKMGRFDEACENLETALKLDPNDSYARLEMGFLYINTNKTKDAIREFKRAAALDTKNPEPIKALGIALMEDNNFLESEKVLRQGLNRFDLIKRSSLHLALSQLLIKQGDLANNSIYYEDALKEIIKSIQINPDNPFCHFYNGIVRFKLEEYQSALACFTECLKQDKYFIEAELNSRRITQLLQRHRSLLKGSKFPTIFLTTIFLMQLIMVWILYLTSEKINSAMISVFVPVLSGLLIISILLPWLSKFKLSGIEAELSDRTLKDSLAVGPKGKIILVSTIAKP